METILKKCNSILPDAPSLFPGKKYGRSCWQGVVLVWWRSQTCWSALSVGGARVSPLYTLWAPHPTIINEPFSLLMLMSLFQCIDGERHLHDTTMTTGAHGELICQRLFKVAHSSPSFWTCSIFLLLAAYWSSFNAQKDLVKQILPWISIIRERVMPKACSESIYSLKLQWLSSLIY